MQSLAHLNSSRYNKRVEQIVGRERNQRACHRQLVRNVVVPGRVNSNVRPPRGESMISIRKGKIQDVAKVSSLLLELSEEFIAAEFSETGKQNFLREFTAEKIAEKMSADNFNFDLAEDDGDLIGVVAVRDHTHLFYLFVAKSQKRGISKILWERARI